MSNCSGGKSSLLRRVELKKKLTTYQREDYSMNEKIKISVFGMRDQAVGGGRCGEGSCQAAPTIGEMYESLADYLEQTDIKDLVEVTFVDIFQNGIQGFAKIEEYMDRGFKLPIVSIDDVKFFHSGVYNHLIYETAKEILAQK